VRRNGLDEADLLYLRDGASRRGVLRSAINYYRTAFRSPEGSAIWPRWLHRLVYGDRPIEGLRRQLIRSS